MQCCIRFGKREAAQELAEAFGLSDDAALHTKGSMRPATEAMQQHRGNVIVR